ncbi:hypothetical protein [Streptomyces caniscabiei]|uniref:hypothetical protein n=1 Tax=Streptomyces caniscabiei TaxID=2746961 RepID=UPI000765C43D|nr:hypothetical protein [Streptomyces caniscabiei]
MLPNCDCGAVDETDHLDCCIRRAAREEWGIADEVAAEDGYRPSRMASLVKHPTHAKTRSHLKAHPFPKQDRRTA